MTNACRAPIIYDAYRKNREAYDIDYVVLWSTREDMKRMSPDASLRSKISSKLFETICSHWLSAWAPVTETKLQRGGPVVWSKHPFDYTGTVSHSPLNEKIDASITQDFKLTPGEVVEQRRVARANKPWHEKDALRDKQAVARAHQAMVKYAGMTEEEIFMQKRVEIAYKEWHQYWAPRRLERAQRMGFDTWRRVPAETKAEIDTKLVRGCVDGQCADIAQGVPISPRDW